jgi:hypothetical protein
MSRGFGACLRNASRARKPCMCRALARAVAAGFRLFKRHLHRLLPGNLGKLAAMICMDTNVQRKIERSSRHCVSASLAMLDCRSPPIATSIEKTAAPAARAEAARTFGYAVDLTIPCWVASPQSPTLFRQTWEVYQATAVNQSEKSGGRLARRTQVSRARNFPQANGKLPGELTRSNRLYFPAYV